MFMAIIKEFKEFISKGNVVDLAVGVIIGAAFGKIITSLVDDILMPPLGFLIGGVDFSEKKIVLIAKIINNKSYFEIKIVNEILFDAW